MAKNLEPLILNVIKPHILLYAVFVKQINLKFYVENESYYEWRF